MTGLLAVLLLLSVDAGTPGAPDGGIGRPTAPARTAEDEEIIQNLDLLEHLTEGQALEMMLDLEAARTKTDR